MLPNRTYPKQDMFMTRHVFQKDMLLKKTCMLLNKIVRISEGYFDTIKITFHSFKQDSCTKMALN